MVIYVGQLPFTTNESDLKELFAAFGEIASVKLIMDHYSGRSKGYGFIDMPSNSEADAAIKALNKTMFQGREIKVNQVHKERRGKRSKRRSRY
ncbi:MAG: RNA-binding protein [Deltaproteobacteria bacterium]|nr:RNA-binding protein [Candidatus Anaeroferrophillus wilburensis]MBN2888213.1 RNA-binding protein [Deltaproteobacteria bacterium]